VTTVQKIYETIDTIAPFALAEKDDNAGVLLGNKETPVRKALLALDMTREVVAEAVEIGAELVITHHPVMYIPIQKLSTDEAMYHAIQAGLSMIAAHTNIDIAEGGLNDILAEKLGLTDTTAYEIGRVGAMQNAFTSKELACHVKNCLGCEWVRYVPSDGPIQKVGICTGGGGSYMYEAAEMGAQAFITGDIRHHEMMYAKEKNITLIDAGHFDTENILMPVLQEKLSELLPEVGFVLSRTCENPLKYV